ncbi:MAG: glycosyltransferase family 2 protein, partial [Acidimicrobiales bacterium]
MDSAEQVPPVVAVVVTSDSGPWLEETLAALAAQSYRNLSVLVVDSGSAEDPTSRVAEVFPGAYVRRLADNVGFAQAANEVLHLVEGASHYLLCHDDVAPDPDAVQLMVEEAFRSNAGIVAPKLVDWHDARRLLQVGMGADKSGAPAPLVDRGDFDQGQHDGVRDVFVAPGGCTLVRADLFADLGGFDPGMHLFGEDLDLSWRAQVSGARVVVAPQARVRHLEAMSNGRRLLDDGAPAAGSPGSSALQAEVRPLQLRHRLRAVLTCYGLWHLLRVLPQVALLAAAEVVFGVLSGHTRTAADTARAWSWNLRHLGEVRSARRRVKAGRRIGDTEVRRLQAPGSARFSGFLRGQLASERIRRRTEEALFHRRPRAGEDATAGPGVRLTLGVMAGVAVVLLVGSRHLLTGRLPAVHELAPFPGGPSAFFSSIFTGWRPTGLGSSGPAPPALALLGLGSLVTWGATALLRTVVLLGTLPLGAVGAYRLARPLGSRKASLVALVVYVAVPLPYNALANGGLGGLVAYAAAPWVLARLLRAGGVEPFGDQDTVGRPGLRDVVALGLLVAVAAAFAPPLVIMVLLVALGLALGGLVSGDVLAGLRGLALAGAGVGVAAVLLLPWSSEFVLPGGGFSALAGAGVSQARSLGLGALLRLESGPLGAPPLGWALPALAALGLLVGRGWRLAWALRLWVVVLTCVGVGWAGGRGWLGVAVPSAEVLLAPAAAALALAAALGIVAVETDLRGYRFGWRQFVPSAAVVAIVLGCLPVAGAALGGRWHVPRTDFAGLLSWMPAKQSEGPFRVLWVGDPQALPLGSYRLGDGVSFATSRGGPPDVRSLWPGGSAGGTGLVKDALRVAREGGTTSLGHLLGPSAIRYLVVPLRAAPGNSGLEMLPPPADIPLALDA